MISRDHTIKRSNSFLKNLVSRQIFTVEILKVFMNWSFWM